MKTRIAGRNVLILMGVALLLVVGSAAIAFAYPAAGESFPTGPTGGTSCAAAEGLAPQLRKEPELRAACAPSAPVIVEVPDVRQPAPITATGSPVRALLPWIAVALAIAAAVSVRSIRARLRTQSGALTGVVSLALVVLMLLTGCGSGDPAPTQEAVSATSEVPEPSGEEQLSRVDLEDGAWPFLALVGSGTLVCEDDGAITFTPPAGGDTYAVNRVAQDAGYADISGISCKPGTENPGCPENPSLDPILERGLELCTTDIPPEASEPAI